MRNRKFLMLLSLLVALSMFGCAKKQTDEKQLVAKVGSCEITIDDFQNDAVMMLSRKNAAENPEKAKEELLDGIITKKVLLQEAQEKNYDKNRAFMREIERYWEQALLKLLIKEKMRELLQKITVKDEEIAKEYEKLRLEQSPSIQPLDKMAPMIRSDIKRRKAAAAFTQWISSLRKSARVKIYNENLKGIKID